MATDCSDHPAGQAAGAVVYRSGRPLGPGRAVGAVFAGLLLLALVGWLAWTQGILAGLRWVEFDSPLTLAAFGFVAGIGAFFAPCAFALFPGYVSYYLASSGDGRERPARSILVGLACAAGSMAFFALVGGALSLLGGAISPYLIATKPFIAFAVAALGLALVADVRLPALPRPRASRGGADRQLPFALGAFLYGFGYALASTGCTLPIYVTMIVLPLTSGYAGAALLTFASFGSAMALMMLLTSVLVGLARTSLLSQLQASTVWIQRASGAVLILAGLYLGYYYARAGM